MAKKPNKTIPGANPVARTMPGLNGGTLQRGGTNPGAGRPRSEVTRAALLAFDERIPTLGAIADSTESRDTDVIAAINALGKAGGVGKEPAVNKELIRELAEAVEAELPDIEGLDMDEVKKRIYDRWTFTLGRYAAGDA